MFITEKGSIIKIIISLFIISLYVFLFGIMQTVESINMSIETADAENSGQQAAPAVTSGVNEEGMAVYTYTTELNVLSAKKPRLADYSRTETMLLMPEEADVTKAETTTVPADFVMQGDDLDYTVPLTSATTTPPETTSELTTTTTASATTTTTATTSVTETAATTPAPTEVSETEQPEDDEDVEDVTDEHDVTYITSDTTIPPDSSESETATSASETDESTTATTTTSAATEPVYSDNNEMFTVNAGGTIITDTALNIVSAAVMAEISDIFDDEAIKAQAIAAYTYIKYYNMNGKNAYIAKSKPSEKVINLVRQVLGKALYYDGVMIQAVYTASTAGRTASSKNVWGVDYPYLQSIDTSFIDEEYDINYGRKPTFTSQELKDYVQKNTGIVLSGDPSQWFTIESYIDDIYVGQMTIGGQSTYNNGTRDVKITGRVFREQILEYNIRSHCFKIDYDAGTDTFTITTYGYGHCVGFSQHGANILASHYGYTYDQILKFYYQGVDIVDMY